MRPVDADNLLWCCKKRMDIEGRLRHRDYAYLKGIRDCIKEIENAPTVELEQKKGKWYLRGITQYDVLPYICTVCGKEANYVYDFCPNCGAKMDEAMSANEG